MANFTSVAKTAAIILAGGQGTRLRSIVTDRQKVVATVAEQPFLSYLLQQLQQVDMREIILACGHLSETVRQALSSFPELKYSEESEPLGTGGALLQALQQTEAESVLVMNGDSFLNLSLKLFLQWFDHQSAPAAMVLTKTADVARYGQVSRQGDWIHAFHEKKACARPGWINAGIYCFHRNLLEDLPWKGNFSLERDLFPVLAARKQLAGFPYEGYFIDIGTPETWQQAQEYFASFDNN